MRLQWDSKFLVLVGALFFLGNMSYAWAAQDTDSRVEASLRKLGRGITNIGSCPAELLRVPTIVGRKDGGLAGASVGVLQGLWRGVLRGLAGVYEVVTFPIPIPKDYAVIIQPEFIWVKGNWAE